MLLGNRVNFDLEFQKGFLLVILVSFSLSTEIWANNNPDPDAVIASPSNNAVVYDGVPVSLSANGSQANGAPYMTYRWRVLPSEGSWSTVCGPTTSSSCKNNSYTFPALGGSEDEKQYTVELQVVTSYGSDTKTVQVTLKRYRERSYYLTDHLGSVRTTVDMDGNVKGYDDYYPFGLPMTGHSSNSSNPNDDYKFTGYEKEDEGNLNLYHANARGYDPILGRFYQIDPHYSSYPGWSPFAYTFNNPLNYTDPTGMDSCEDDDSQFKCKLFSFITFILTSSSEVSLTIDVGAFREKTEEEEQSEPQERQIAADAMLQDLKDEAERAEGLYNVARELPGGDVILPLMEGNPGEAALNAATYIPLGRVIKVGKTAVPLLGFTTHGALRAGERGLTSGVISEIIEKGTRTLQQGRYGPQIKIMYNGKGVVVDATEGGRNYGLIITVLEGAIK